MPLVRTVIKLELLTGKAYDTFKLDFVSRKKYHERVAFNCPCFFGCKFWFSNGQICIWQLKIESVIDLLSFLFLHEIVPNSFHFFR